METERKLYQARLVAKNWLTPTMIQASITVQSPTGFRFMAGQFVSVKVGDPAFRSYSICSDSTFTDMFDLLVDVKSPGIGADFFRKAQQDDEVSFIGPAGKFHLRPHTKDSIVFVATGAGIAPFISIMQALMTQQFSGKVSVYFGIRTYGDALFLDFFEKAKSELKDFELTLCLSQEQNSPYGRYGRVTSLFDYTQAQESDIYICGNPNMVDELKGTLEKLGIHEEQIHSEKFTTRRNRRQQQNESITA